MFATYLKSRLFILFVLLISCNVMAKESVALQIVNAANLPPEARVTLVLIRNNGPFPHVKDGAVFGNYEKLLPKQKRGYYHEFTVKTKGARNRGARRIVVGGEPATSRDLYYTDDHYASFRRIEE